MTQRLVAFLERHSLSAHKIPTPAKDSKDSQVGVDKSEGTSSSSGSAKSAGNDTDAEIAAEKATGRVDGGVQTDPEPEPEPEPKPLLTRRDYGPAPVEPAAGPDVCRVQFKFASGQKTVVLRFFKSATLRELYAVVAAMEAVGDEAFELNTTFPAKTLDPAGGSVLDEGVAGAQVLVRML